MSFAADRSHDDATPLLFTIVCFAADADTPGVMLALLPSLVICRLCCCFDAAVMLAAAADD